MGATNTTAKSLSMRTLVFDTETTGKADFKADPAAMHQPYLVQLAAQLYVGRELVQEVNVICLPEQAEGMIVQIPAEATGIHGISNDTTALVGLPYKLVLPLFNNLLKRTDRVVAHNLQFDVRVMSGAYKRNGYPQDDLQRPERICTMLQSEGVLKIPSKFKPGGYKWPTLDEAFRHLVNKEGFEGAHDASNDCTACVKVLWALEDAGIIPKS